MASLPSGSQYVEALQFPAGAFLDEELAEGEVDSSALGLPRPISGNIASVFGVTTADGQRYAVRCFVRAFDDQAHRYAAISHQLAAVSAAWKVPFEYIPEGIFVAGQILPIVKMAWAEGTALDNFVEANLWNGPVLAAAAHRFAAILEDLQRSGIAHGDLQHGNILVTADGDLRLIDYDGMYVPALAGLPANELGHRNYRHPSRVLEEFGPWLDNFAGWVIFLSLATLSIDPLLWGRLDGGDERLLFREEDFVDPERSEAFQLMLRHEHATIRYYGAVLRQLCQVPPSELPALSLTDAPQLAPPESAVRAAGSSDADSGLLEALRSADTLHITAGEEEATSLRERMKRLATKDLLAAAPGPEPVEVAELRARVGEADNAVLAAQAARDELDADEEEQRRQAAAGIEGINRREADELRAIGDELVRVRALLAQQERDLGLAEQRERAEEIKKHAELARAEALNRERIVAAPGIPDSIAFALARLGVRTASDMVKVTAEPKKGRKQPPGVVSLPDGRTVEVGGIGPTEAVALMNWKRAAEGRAAKAAEEKLPEQVELDLARRYAEQRQALRAEEPRARAQAARLEQEAVERAETDRARVAAALQEVQQAFAAERIKLDRALANARKDAAEARFHLQQAEARYR